MKVAYGCPCEPRMLGPVTNRIESYIEKQKNSLGYLRELVRRPEPPTGSVGSLNASKSTNMIRILTYLVAEKISQWCMSTTPEETYQ